MGSDKALLPFGGYSTLVEYQYFRLKKIFSYVFISSKSADKFESQILKDAVIPDPISDTFAPTAGFISSFKENHHDKIFVLSVDTPFVDEKSIMILFHHDNNKLDATIAKTENSTHPMCGIYHRSLKKEFIKMFEEDNHKLGFLLKNSETNYVNFDDESLFLNLNHPHEYKEALEKILL